MLRLFGFYTQNTLKVLYVLEALDAEYEFKFVDLFKGEHKREEFQKLTPVGKVPLLQVGNEYIFESGAMCRFVANEANSPLYPENKLSRAKVDQWMDFFSIHLGHWLSTLYFENIIKEKAGMGARNPEKCREAEKFAHQQFRIIDKHLAENEYFTGDELTIADLFAFAYIEQVREYDFSLKDYPNVEKWFNGLERLESIARARKKVNI